MLEFLRWISAADHRCGAHLEAAVLGWRFPAGTAALYEAVAAEVSGEVRLGTPVAAVEQDVRWRDRRHSGRGAPLARRAPSSRCRSACCPRWPSRRRWSAAKRAAGERNHAGQGVKAWAIARGVPDDLCAMGQGTRFDFAAAMATQRRRRPAGLLRALGRRLSTSAITRRSPRLVRELAPEAEVVAVRAHDWAGDPNGARHVGRAAPRPGARRLVRPARAGRGRVHFAGAHTALRWPSFMDGAIESGHRVAEEVAAAAPS